MLAISQLKVVAEFIEVFFIRHGVDERGKGGWLDVQVDGVDDPDLDNQSNKPVDTVERSCAATSQAFSFDKRPRPRAKVTLVIWRSG